MITPTQELELFIYKVDYMRGRQRTYFQNRNEHNLRMAKNAERDVDESLRHLEKKGYKPLKPSTPQQQQIF